MYKNVKASEAVKVIRSNDRVYVQAAAAAPQLLMKAMTERYEELKNVEVCHLHVEKRLMQTLNCMKVFM